VRTILKSKWAIAAAAASSMVGAQAYVNNACTTATSTPCFDWKQDADRRYYQITYDVRAECDDEIIAGATAWENAGSRFSTYHDATYPDYVYNYSVRQEGYQIFWEPASQMADPAFNAETRRGWANGSSWRRPDGVYIPMVMDADIAINADRFAMGLMECTAAAPTSTQRDLARTIAHEFGHVVGMDHLTLTACALYEKAQPGVAWTSLCSTETGGARTLYGVR
jgi:hypothetical protein